jgi:hypothetical protein
VFVIIYFQVFRRILDGRKEMFEEDQGRNLLRMLYEILSERTGTKQRDGNLLGWNIWRAHVALHQDMERMMYGYSETTSA